MIVNKHVCRGKSPAQTYRHVTIDHCLNSTPQLLDYHSPLTQLTFTTTASSHEYQQPETSHGESQAEHVWSQSVWRWTREPVSGLLAASFVPS